MVRVKFWGEDAGLTDASNKAEKSIKGVGEQAEHSDGKLSKFSSGLGKASQIAGGFVLGAGILKAPGFLMDAANAAADDEAATARLQQTVRNMGGDYDALMKSVNAQIDAGQKLAFSDDEVRDSFQFLAQATNDSDEALRRQKLAMDLARGGNMSLDAASKLLGKTSEENINTLKKLGIEVAEGATEADVLAGVQARFAGQSEAYAKSTAGQFAQAKLAMGEVVEGIGGAVLPIMAKLGTALAEHLPAIQAFVGELGGKVAEVVAPALERVVELAMEFGRVLVDQIVPVAVSLWADMQPHIETVRQAFEELVPKVQEFATILADRLAGPAKQLFDLMGGLEGTLKAVGLVVAAILVPAFAAWAISVVIALAPVIAITVGIAALVAGVAILIQNWDTITEKIPALGIAFDAVKNAIAVTLEWIKKDFVPGFMVVLDTVVKAVGDAIAFVQKHWDSIRAVIEPAVELLFGIVQLYFDNIKVAIETAINVAIGLVQVAIAVFKGDWDTAWKEIKQIVFDIWEGIKGIFGNFVTFLKDTALPLMKEAAKNIANTIGDEVAKLPERFTNIGSAIGQAFIDALKAMAGGVFDAAKGLGGAALDGVKAGAGKLWPGSPSKAGLELGYAFGWGIREGGLAALPMVDEMVDQVTGAMTVRVEGGRLVRDRDRQPGARQTATIDGEGRQPGARQTVTIGGEGGPSSSPEPPPGTMGSGWAFVADGKGGLVLAEFPLPAGTPYFYWSLTGEWLSGIVDGGLGDSAGAGRKPGARQTVVVGDGRKPGAKQTVTIEDPPKLPGTVTLDGTPGAGAVSTDGGGGAGVSNKILEEIRDSLSGTGALVMRVGMFQEQVDDRNYAQLQWLERIEDSEEMLMEMLSEWKFAQWERDDARREEEVAAAAEMKTLVAQVGNAIVAAVAASAAAIVHELKAGGVGTMGSLDKLIDGIIDKLKPEDPEAEAAKLTPFIEDNLAQRQRRQLA